MKKTFFLFLIFNFSFTFSQNKEVKELIKIDKQFDSLLIAYQIKAKDSLSNLSKKERLKIMAEYESKKNKERNEKILKQLEIIKISENQNITPEVLKCTNENIELPNLFQRKSKYKPTIDKGLKISNSSNEDSIKSTVTFVVTSDGYIKNVIAVGNNDAFNKELEITLYKIERWKPSCDNGHTITERFKMPVTMNF